MAPPLRLFVSYSHADSEYRKRLRTHLAPLLLEGLIGEVWNDRLIRGGENWADEIDVKIEEADIILLLISADFIASDYCVQREMKLALARHEQGEARVVPLFVRPSLYEKMPFARLQGFPRDNRAVSTWQDPDAAWVEVVTGIRTMALAFGGALGEYDSIVAAVDSVAPSRNGGPRVMAACEPQSTTSRFVHTRRTAEHQLEEILPIDAYGLTEVGVGRKDEVMVVLHCPAQHYLQRPLQMQKYTPVSALCLLRAPDFVETFSQKIVSVRGRFMEKPPGELEVSEKTLVAHSIAESLVRGFVVSVALPKVELDHLCRNIKISYQKLASVFLLPLLSGHRRRGAGEVHVRICQTGEQDRTLLQVAKTSVKAMFGRKGSVDFVGPSESDTELLGAVVRFSSWAVGHYYNYADSRYLRALGEPKPSARSRDGANGVTGGRE
jgi:hypothetical protein